MIFLNNLFGGGSDGGGAGGIDYVNGNLYVTLPTTEFIHGDTFNTSGATVTYKAPDGTETDVTSAASFDPSNGSTLNIDGENTVRVSYTPSGKSTVYATQVITVAPIPESLTVILHDNAMRAGEYISYKGARVKCMMTDRTEKDVSGATLTWSPLEGTQQNNDGNVSVTCSYTENGVTVSGTTAINVTDRILTRISMALGKTQYYYGDNFDTTNTVVTATYDDGTTGSVKDHSEFLPENRSKLESHGDKTVVCTYTENSITKTVTGTINVKPVPTKLDVKFADGGFRVGDRLSYSGATVTATWSNGSTSDVTNLVTWDPVSGTELSSGSKTIKATYETENWKIDGSTTINVNGLVLTSISGTFTKKDYYEGEELDLTGAKVTALFDNGSTQDITDKVSWNPSEGHTLKKGDAKVTCSYSENGVKKTFDVAINVHYVTDLSITGLPTTYDATDPVSYDNVTVVAVYDDGHEETVTDSVTWSPSDGHKLETTDNKIRATYRTNSSNTITKDTTITVNDVPTKLEVNLSVTDFEVGNNLSFSGAQILLTYASGRTDTLGVGDVSWSPAAGTKLKKKGTQYITATYNGEES